MTRVLAHHEKRRASLKTAGVTKSELGLGGFWRNTSSKANGVGIRNGGGATNGINGVVTDGVNGISHINGKENAQNAESPNPMNIHDTPTPAVEAMSKQTLLVKHKDEKYDAINRRSARRVQTQQASDPNAALYINVRNIRKMLNWKTNKPDPNVRPRKRARLETVPCHAHLAIWDNSPGKKQEDPIISQTEPCDLLKSDQDAASPAGKFVELKLEDPFIIPKKRLNVAVRRGNEAVLELGRHYFLELKIVPARSDEQWPPIPIKKSKGDNTTRLDALAKDKLQDSLIVRYQRLPELPDKDTAYPVFYLNEGITFETKYGLEFDAKWTTDAWLASKASSVEEEKEDIPLEDWQVDTNGNTFGRHDPARRKEPRADKPQYARKSTGRGALAPVAPAPLREKAEIVFRIGSSISKNSQNEFKAFRNAKVTGLICPSCPGIKFRKLTTLQLHFENTHHKYRFILEDSEMVASKVKSAVFRIEALEPVRPRKIQDHPKEEHFTWSAPTKPFDIDEHLNGDRSWLGEEEARSKPRKQHAQAQALSGPLILDPLTALRNGNAGHLPPTHVPPFRPSSHARQKHPNIRLRTINPAQSAPYTSISHRPLVVEDPDEDARSETDDETEDTWFVNRYLEELDIHAEEEGWSVAQRRLRRMWGFHVLGRERNVHARYISDSLVRFVRMYRKWIVDTEKNEGGIAAFMELTGQLHQQRAITDDFSADVLSLLFAEDGCAPELPQEEAELVQAGQLQDAHREAHIEQRNLVLRGRNLPARTIDNEPPREITVTNIGYEVCHICRHTIEQPKLAVLCSRLDCPTRDHYYHARCAGLTWSEDQTESTSFEYDEAVITGEIIKARRSWKCRLCQAHSKKDATLKGKGKEKTTEISSVEPLVLPSVEQYTEERDISVAPSYKPLSTRAECHSGGGLLGSMNARSSGSRR